MHMSRTALRLSAVFLVIFVLFAATLAVTLFTLEEINSVESEVTKIDHAKHTGHLAAAQVREQYIHQVHVLVNRNLQRLEHYEQVAALTRERTKQLQQLPLASEEQTLADQVMRLAEANDQTFREEVIPALERSLDPRTHGLSERLEAHVDKVVHLNEALNLKLEQRSLALMQHAQQLRTNARVVVLACFTLAIMVSLVLGLLLIRSILRPLGVLRAGVLKIAEGDLGTRIHLEGRDEFAELAACFNRMARDLVRHQEDRMRSQKLAAIGQIAAGLAHEINNPLGVILGYVKLMLMAPDQVKASELQIVEDEARQCQKIVQGLLELARPVRLHQGPVDLAEIARETVARFKESGRLQGLKVAPLAADRRAMACGDETKLRQVVYNILSNAVEAMPSGGQLGIEVAGNSQEVCLTVSDRGSGIAPEVMPHLFEPFFTTKPTGTGLGLVTSQAIIHAHGGRVAIQTNPGGGTRVSVSLPVPAALPSAEPV